MRGAFSADSDHRMPAPEDYSLRATSSCLWLVWAARLSPSAHFAEKSPIDPSPHSPQPKLFGFMLSHLITAMRMPNNLPIAFPSPALRLSGIGDRCQGIEPCLADYCPDSCLVGCHCPADGEQCGSLIMCFTACSTACPSAWSLVCPDRKTTRACPVGGPMLLTGSSNRRVCLPAVCL